MHQGVGFSYDFYHRCPILVDGSEAEQNQLLVFEETIYVCAEDIAPKNQEHKSTFNY